MHLDLPPILARLRGLAALPETGETPATRTLAPIARALGEALGFATVAINLYRPAWDDFEVVAVFGSEEAQNALLDETTQWSFWEPLLQQRFERHGAYLVPEGEFDWAELEGASYVPDLPPSDDPDAWRAEDALFVPMLASDGTVLGIVSVDVPESGRRPTDDQLQLLVAVAEHAAHAVESLSVAEETARYRRAVEQLLRVSAELTHTRSAEAVLQTICEAVRDALGFRLVAVELADRRADRYQAIAAAGIDIDATDVHLDAPIADFDSIYDPAFEREGCYLLPREEAFARVGCEPSGFQSSQNGRGPRAWNRHWLVVPMVGADGERLGFVWADEPEDRLIPSSSRLQALRMFANHAVTALESAGRLEELRARNAELEALHDTTLALIERLEPVTVLESVVTRAGELLKSPHGFLYLVDPRQDELELVVGVGVFTEYAGARLKRGEGLAGRIWVEGQPFAVDDYAEWADRAQPFRDAGFHAVFGVPIRAGDEVVGVLGLGYPEPDHTVSKLEQELLGRFGQLASLALENARLYTAARHELEERRQAEQRLRTERDYSDRLIQSANALIVGLDRDGSIQVFNREAEELTGYTRDEVHGLNWFEVLVPKDRYPEVWREFDGGELPAEFEYPILTKDGVERVVSWRNRVLTLDGEEVGTISFGVDLTERKKLEEELRQSQKMEAVGRLAGGVAHDFNNLLTAIIASAELSLADLPAASPVRGHAHDIRRAAEQAASLTRQLLAFSRRQVLEPEVLDLNAVVLELEGMLDRLLGERVELVTDLEPRLGHTRVDPGQLQQVVLNLAINARDAMPEGGTVTIETRNVELVETEEAEPGEYVRLAVRDTGEGMDEATLQHAFEPFFTTKPLGAGTGLGLSTVYGIVSQTGGHVHAESELERGTSIEVYLPLVREQAAARRDPQPVTGPNGSETVLLVEDQEMVRGAVRAMLEAGGYEVLEAADGAAALEVAEQHAGRIDVLMSDVVMPGMSGPELSEELVARYPGLRVLLTSGYAEDAVALSGGTFLQKPFTAAELAQKLREALDERLVA